MKGKIAIFSSKGIGDGMFAVQLAHQWALSGSEATVFHPLIFDLSSLFPHIKIEKDPSYDEKGAHDHLASFERIIFIYENSPRQMAWREFSLEHFEHKTWVINPIPSRRNDSPYWDHGRFDGHLSFAENIAKFCKYGLFFPSVSFSQGLVMKQSNKKQSEKIRVAIHPFSSKEGKNWHLDSYIELAKELEKRGIEVLWIGTEKEKSDAGLGPFPLFNHLLELAEFLRDIDLFIGNDSGVGHLSSAIGIPTVTICRNMRIIRFWQPSWSNSLCIAPPAYIPNLKPFRWRDRNWKSLITVKRVLKRIEPLLKKLNESNSDELGVFDDQGSHSTVDELDRKCCPQR